MGQPQRSSRLDDQAPQELVRLARGRSASRTRRVSYNAPKLRNAGQCNAPTAGIIAGFLDGAPGGTVLGNTSTMGVYQEVGVNGNHPRRSSHWYIFSRSATSNPRGKPPFAVTHRMARRRRPPREAPRGWRSSRRRPRSKIFRSVVLLSTALFLAAIRSSSGKSIVVFIYGKPYYHKAVQSVEVTKGRRFPANCTVALR